RRGCAHPPAARDSGDADRGCCRDRRPRFRHCRNRAAPERTMLPRSYGSLKRTVVDDLPARSMTAKPAEFRPRVAQSLWSTSSKRPSRMHSATEPPKASGYISAFDRTAIGIDRFRITVKPVWIVNDGDETANHAAHASGSP